MTSETTRWVVEWFEKRGPVPGAALADKAALDYFEAGLLDSMAVVELVAAVEERFGVRFTDAHFSERRFSTIGGVAEIVDSLRAP